MRVRTVAAVLALMAITLGVQLRPVVAAARAQPRVGCAQPAPTTAAGYQAMFDAKNDLGWSGGDQAASLVLPGGRVLWLFGDTVQGLQAPTGGYAPGSRMVHNSFLLQDRGCLTALNGRERGEVIPNAANGDWYWPQTAMVDRGRLIVFATRVRRTGPGSMDFRTVGTDAATFTLHSGRPVFSRMTGTPSSGVGDSGVQYGAALVARGPFTYVYGTQKVGGDLVFGRAVTLARVPAGSLLQQAKWRFWTGTTWSARRADAAAVVKAAPHGWSTVFSVLPQRGGVYRFITKADDYLGRDVVTGFSRGLERPAAASVVATYASAGNEVYYNPLAHPEAQLAGGALLLTICHNSTDLATIHADGDLYKPQFFTAP